MSSQMFAMLCFATLLIVASQSSDAMAVPPFCQSGMVEDMPPHIQKVCSALNNSEQLATALKSYLNSEAAGKIFHFEIFEKFKIFIYDKFSHTLAMLTDQAPLKRSDVDHVFLRFGKRR